MKPTSILVATCLGACASPPAVPSVRFVNAPAAAAVDDRLDVPAPPRSQVLFLDAD